MHKNTCSAYAGFSCNCVTTPSVTRNREAQPAREFTVTMPQRVTDMSIDELVALRERLDTVIRYRHQL